jgi:tRNA threonylcarbamoyladenosine biosynthesis protein TsaE
MRVELETLAADDTRALGEAIAQVLRDGDAAALTGDLGAGKTTFVQGIARGLGSPAHVASPTFTLVREYDGRLPIHHVDVYRLDRVQEVLDLALDEIAASGGVLLVEWGDAVEGLLPDDHLLVELTVVGEFDEDDRRRILLRAVGPSWRSRWEQLERVVEPWAAAA